MFNHFIKLGSIFAIRKITPVTRSNGKQNIQFLNKTFVFRFAYFTFDNEFVFRISFANSKTIKEKTVHTRTVII